MQHPAVELDLEHVKSGTSRLASGRTTSGGAPPRAAGGRRRAAGSGSGPGGPWRPGRSAAASWAGDVRGRVHRDLLGTGRELKASRQVVCTDPRPRIPTPAASRPRPAARLRATGSLLPVGTCRVRPFRPQGHLPLAHASGSENVGPGTPRPHGPGAPERDPWSRRRAPLPSGSERDRAVCPARVSHSAGSRDSPEGARAAERSRTPAPGRSSPSHSDALTAARKAPRNCLRASTGS